MRIKLIHNPTKEWTFKVRKELRNHLIAAGYKIVNKNADTTICIGGDGTILYANYKGWLEGNVLGIGSEKSFICQLRRDDWRERIEEKLSEGVIKIQMLEAKIREKCIRAINDVVVHTTDYRVVEISLDVGRVSYRFRGDGIIVSSAIGSSSYAYSAGGKKLTPEDKRIVIVPIAPYRRMFAPKIVRDGEIRIRCDRKAALIIDGIFIRNLKPRETVRIKKNGLLKFYKGVGFFG